MLLSALLAAVSVNSDYLESGRVVFDMTCGDAGNLPIDPELDARSRGVGARFRTDAEGDSQAQNLENGNLHAVNSLHIIQG